MQDCAHAGTADAVAAQLGAIPGTHDVGAPAFPPPGALVVPPIGALVGAVGPAVVEGDPPPTQDPGNTGALAQAQTALAEASTAPMLPGPQPAMTHGAAVAWIAAD